MKLTIWLCASESDELSNLIQYFSNELDAPVFMPHITLLGSVELDDPVSYLDVTADICNDLNPVEVTLDGIGFEELIWRCFYYRAYPKERLLDYHETLVAKLTEFGARKNEDFMPHLSLIYQNMTVSQQEKLFRQNRELLLSRSLIFDTIKVVHFIPGNIEGWKILASIPLYN